MLVGGGLLAPWVWHAAQAWADASAASWVDRLASQPFHRYVHRCLLILALAGLPWFSRALGIRRWADAGFVWRPGGSAFWRPWGLGLLLGLATFLPALGIEGGMGAREFRWPAAGTEVLSKTVEILAGAILVGALEEALFRGVLFGGLRRTTGTVRAVVVSSLVYALVHFFERPAPPALVTWYSGLDAVAQMLCGLARWDRWVPFFGTLTLAGILLARLYQASGSLWLPMGMHTGWVIALKMRGWLTVRPPGRGGEGELPMWEWLCLAGIGVVLAAHLAPRRTFLERGERSGERRRE